MGREGQQFPILKKITSVSGQRIKLIVKLLLLCLFLLLKNGNISADDTFESSRYSLVYVYLGEKIPEYTLSTITQARLFNTNAQIYFILSQNTLEKQKSLIEKLKVLKIHFVKNEELVKSPEHIEFERRFAVFKAADYWKYTTERFYCIQELMQKYLLKDVVQVECDVMLYFNIEDYLDLFHTYYAGMAAPFESDNVASVSFVYFANENACRNFTHYITQYYIDNNTIKCEMLLLASYKNSHSDQEIDHLPTICSQDFSVINGIGEVSTRPWKNWNYISEWDSLFDPDWLGQYLVEGQWWGGQCFMNPALFYFQWERDEQGRKIPYAYYFATRHRYRLNTLHVFPKKFDGCLSIGGSDLPSRIGSQW